MEFRKIAAIVVLAGATGLAATSARADDIVNNGATRAFDRAAGTNASGAYPLQSDGMPGNPPGSAAGRAFDRAAQTNTSGAYPLNELRGPDGTPSTIVGGTLNGNLAVTTVPPK